MDRRKFNRGQKNNKGGGHPTEKDNVWHKEKWELDQVVADLQKKIDSGVYSVRDVFLFKALVEKNDRILGIFADKLLADLVDMTSQGEKMEGMVIYSPRKDN